MGRRRASPVKLASIVLLEGGGEAPYQTLQHMPRCSFSLICISLDWNRLVIPGLHYIAGVVCSCVIQNSRCQTLTCPPRKPDSTYDPATSCQCRSPYLQHRPPEGHREGGSARYRRACGQSTQLPDILQHDSIEREQQGIASLGRAPEL